MGAVNGHRDTKHISADSPCDHEGAQQHDEVHKEGPTITGPTSDTGIVKPMRCWESCKQTTCAPSTKLQKVFCALFWTATVVVAALLFAVIFPRFVDRVVTPFINILKHKLTPPQIGAVIFAAIIILPFTLVITVIPFVWVAGIVFTFPVALAIVMAGSAVGMALQYLLARYILHDRVERFVNNSPKRHGLSVTLRAVELAGPWRVVALLRLGPFPYHLLNYALGICPSIKFHVYILCSVVCEILPRALQVFFGKSLDTLADLFKGNLHNIGVAVYNVCVLLVGVLFVVFSVIMARRLLKRLEQEEVQKEAAAAEDAENGLQPDKQVDQTAAGSCGAAGHPLQMCRRKVQSKLPLGVAPAAAVGQADPSEGDIEISVADGCSNCSNCSSSQQPMKSCTLGPISRLCSGRTGSSSSSLISVGLLPQISAAGLSSCSSSSSQSNSVLH